MEPTLIVIRFLHILSAIAWFALPLAIVSLLKLGLKHHAAFEDVGRMVQSRAKFATLAGLFTLATGLWAVFYRGGFKFVLPTIHAGLGIVVIMLLIGPLVMRPAGMKLIALAQSGEHESPEAKGHLRRIAMFSGILQLLWTVVLVLMVWR